MAPSRRQPRGPPAPNFLLPLFRPAPTHVLDSNRKLKPPILSASAQTEGQLRSESIPGMVDVEPPPSTRPQSPNPDGPGRTRIPKNTRHARPRPLDATHRCPICGEGLLNEGGGDTMRENYLRYKKNAEFQRRKLELGWGEKGNKFVKKEDEDAIVVGTCGELFHKKCLLLYCSRSALQTIQGASSSSRSAMRSFHAQRHKNTCPRCNAPLRYSHYQEIDLDSHRCKGKKSSCVDRSYDELRLHHQELLYNRELGMAQLQKMADRVKEARKGLKAVQKKRAALSDALPTTSPLLLKTEHRRCQMRIAEKKAIEQYIHKSQEVIEFMQKQTPNTMRLYIQEVISGKPLDEIHNRTQIPRMLIPYLHQIAEDDNCLFALSQIVEPQPYPGTNFQLDDLLLGILRNVNPSLGQKLISVSKRSGCSVMSAYDELFPDTCLKILRSYRDLRQAQSDAAVKDSKGNELEITIMYLVDDEEANRSFNLPPKLCIKADKASEFHLLPPPSSNANFEVIQDSGSSNTSSNATHGDTGKPDMQKLSSNFLPDEAPTPPISETDLRQGPHNVELKGGLLTEVEKPPLEYSVHASPSNHTRITFTISELKMIGLPNEEIKSKTASCLTCPTDDGDAGSGISSVPTVPPPPCPSCLKPDEVSDRYPHQQLKMLVVNPIETEYNAGARAVIRRMLRYPRVHTQIQTEVQDSSTTTITTTTSEEEEEEEEFMHLGTPVRTNYGETTPGAWLLPPTSNITPPNEKTDPAGVAERKLIEAVDSTLIIKTPRCVTRSLEGPTFPGNLPDIESRGLPDEAAGPLTTFMMECETPKRVVFRLPSVYPSATSIQSNQNKLDTELSEFEDDNPHQSLRKVQARISELCVKVEPPTQRGHGQWKYLDPNNKRSLSCTSIKPNHHETGNFMSHELRTLRQQRDTGPLQLPPLPQPHSFKLPPEEKGMQIFLNATAAAAAAASSRHPNNRSQSRTTKSKRDANANMNSTFASKSKSKKNYVAANIEAAFRTPTRTVATITNYNNSNPISSNGRSISRNGRKSRRVRFSPSKYYEEPPILNNYPPPLIAPSKSLNSARKRKRQPAASQKRRAKSNSQLKTLEAKRGVLDMHSLLNRQRQQDLWEKSRARELMLKASRPRPRRRGRGQDDDERYYRRKSPPDPRYARNVGMSKEDGLTRSRLINWRQNI